MLRRYLLGGRKVVVLTLGYANTEVNTRNTSLPIVNFQVT